MNSRKPVHNVNFHFVWCPKYRRSVLEGDVAIRARELITEKLGLLGITEFSLEVMPNHVHLFVKSSNSLSPDKIMNQIKGYTSRNLREEFPSVRTRLPSLWTKSYYCESVGSLTQEAVEKYVQNQKNV